MNTLIKDKDYNSYCEHGALEIKSTDISWSKKTDKDKIEIVLNVNEGWGY